MNIKEAKIHIKNTIEAYFEKNDTDDYLIPVEKQRPIFLYGPPGIGKTAIMEQIAEEMDIGLVSYSMTHHTRQSAIGLPFITKKVFDGKEYDVSEYTMSEILASVYEYIEKSGKDAAIFAIKRNEGILLKHLIDNADFDAEFCEELYTDISNSGNPNLLQIVSTKRNNTGLDEINSLFEELMLWT